MHELTKAHSKAMRIQFDDNSKFVIMSDVHRGLGKRADDFSKNKDLFLDTLKNYYDKEFSYIELGDGEELWENRSFKDIILANLDVYLLLKKFNDKDRLHLTYGNHDKAKQNEKYLKDNLHKYKISDKYGEKPLCSNAKVHEALILNHKHYKGDILLVHGHQTDFFNNKLWYLSRFLVRHLWKHLESIGVQDPTRTAQVYSKKKAVERKITEWILQTRHMVIAGHTHKPMFSEPGAPPYFNDGSCVTHGAITAIEIENGKVCLVKWSRSKSILEKSILAGPTKIQKYFSEICCENTDDQ